MRISYLELKNYRRFKELKLQFPDGIVGILGLNGVGKTTLIEGVAWALFGNVDEVVRTSREGIRRAGSKATDSCSAVLEFELGEAEYRIEREMGGKNLTMRAELGNKDKILAQGDKPVREMVQKLIGMDHKSFFTSVFARQKELNALQNVAAGERKKVVLRMLRIDGIDTVLANVRADIRDKQSRIEGAQRTLLSEDGREREKVLEETIPDLERAHQSAATDLVSAESREREITKEFYDLKKRRDDIKKDVDAYNAAIGDLKAKQSQVREMRAREKNLTSRLAETTARLNRLPTLEKDEQAWKDISAKKDKLDAEKANSGKAKILQQEIESDRKELGRRVDEIAKLRAGMTRPEEILTKKEETEKSKTECEVRKSETATKLGELRAKIAEKSEAAARDRKKLEEIKSAGKKGTCPTCERTLEEAYELLVTKLSESSADAEKLVKDCSALVVNLEGEIKALSSKEEALKKKAANLERELTKLRQLETSIETKEGDLEKFKSRMEERGRTLEALGEIAFSDEQYAVVVKDFERLKHLHDEYVGLMSMKAQVSHYSTDLDEIRKQIKRVLNEEEQFKNITETLEPKKSLFDATIKELDEKTSVVNSVKDSVKKASLLKQSTSAQLDRTRKEIDEIMRVRKTIEGDRKLVDDLALLENVLASFKDHLIGRVAPALSALASRNLEVMTEGKYSTAELDENYEMQIDDQGTMYPLGRFSGGESDLANLSLRLAISGIIADRTGASPMNLLILDEIFGSQDPNRKRSVMTALSKLSAQYRQVFLITHIEDIKDSLSSVIRVEEQEDGTSRAVLVG